MPDLIEWFKIGGAFGGVASSAFLIWDRMVKGRPIARWDVDRGQLFVDLANEGTESVLIESVVIPGGDFSWALSDETEDIMAAIQNLPGTAVREHFGPAANRSILLRPNSHIRLLLLSVDENRVPDMLTAVVRWRLLTSTKSWMPSIRLTASRGLLATLRTARIVESESTE